MKRQILLLLSIFIILLGFSQAQEIDVVKLPENSRNDSPVIAFTREGTHWLAWSSFQEGRYRLAVCSRVNGSWTSIEYPNSTAFDQVEPQWAVTSQQRIGVVYSVYDGNAWKVCHVEKKDQGWGSPQVLGQGTHPTVTVLGDLYWIAWEQDSRIAILVIGGEQDSNDPKFLFPEADFKVYSQPQLASGPNGEIWLAWAASQFGYQSVQLKRVDEKNHPILTVDDGYGVNRNPRLSVDGKGRVWVVYEGLRYKKDCNSRYWEQMGRPVYVLDKIYGVENPSRVVKVTDGEQWWSPEVPEEPSLGLMPNVFCSSRGTVWLVSRSFTGYTRPPRYFCPLCESLGPEGWTNHGLAWLKGQSYKAFTSLAEDPEGRVWMVWAQHDRKKNSYTDTPSWTHMDGPDFIAVAPMPELEKEGIPRLVPLEKKRIQYSQPQTFPQYQIAYKGETLQVYFGDLHQHSEISGCGRRNARIDQNQHYSRYVRGLDFMCTIDHAEHMNDHTWRMTQLAAQKYNQSSEFVTFTGFEWTSEFDAGGNLNRGHYNAIFRDVGKGDHYFSASDPCYNTPLELWTALKTAVGGEDNVLTFAHHTSRRMAWLTWNYYDPEMAPLIEISQARGSYEYEGCFSGLELANDCTRVHGHYIQDGLDRGMRWGFVASGDHGGRQLAAVFAPKLDRETIFQSLKARRAYATSGERMLLDVRVNGHFMGEEFLLEKNSRKIDIKAIGTSPLVEIDLFRNGRSIHKWAGEYNTIELEWEDSEPLLRRESYYYVRVIQADGGQAWSSPVWVINPEVRGEFQFQVGGDELRVIYPSQETDFAILVHNEKEKGIHGQVFLDVPDGWTVKEEQGIKIDCSSGGWRHAVFHVTASASALTQICLPPVKARFVYPDGRTLESPLFVVGSPSPLSREQKAVLIDARTEVPQHKFGEYLEKIAAAWQKES